MEKNIKYNFCTLFDKNYLYQGVALYNSLLNHCEDWRLFILCLDEETYNILKKLQLTKARLVKLSEIEDEELLWAKSNRSRGEYCWTLASAFTYRLLKANPNFSNITYLDSDLYFYSSPDKIFLEMGESSILIIRHNYPNKFKYLEKNGIYNVAMMVFKNDEEGRTSLKWWQDEVIKWCYNRCEEGKFGDQAYLDDWPERFKGVHVLNNRGGGDLAPWNLNNYEVSISDNGKILVDKQELIFFHFHTFKVLAPNKFQLYSSFYSFNQLIKREIYGPYKKELQHIIDRIRLVDKDFNYGFRQGESIFEIIKQKAKRLFVELFYYYKLYVRKIKKNS